MARLIPLRLQPVSRPVKQPPLALLLKPPAPPPIPAKSPRRMESKMVPALAALPLLHTQDQWRVVLDEVRAIYLKRQYKQCSIRCMQLLEGAPNTILSLHYIYLSLYAAICLELLARELSIGSPEKLTLFNLARFYYQKTEQYLGEAESAQVIINSEAAGGTLREIHHRFPSSSSDSSAASCSSPATSAPDSPNSYTSSSPVHSPASSVCSTPSTSELEPCSQLKPRPLRVKKAVSFHPNPPTVFSPADSDYMSAAPGALNTFQSGLEKCMVTPTTTLPIDTTNASEIMSSLLLLSLSRSRSRSHSPSHPPSLSRCSTHLSALRARVEHHLSAITRLVLSLQDSPNPTPIPPGAYASTPTPALPDILELGTGHDPHCITRCRCHQRATRIALLKQRGRDWKSGKARFDPSRYERLCREALRELEV